MLEITAWLVNNYQLFLLVPIVLAFKVEQHYISRVTTVTNTMSMFVAIAPYWEQTRSILNFDGIPIFHWYLAIGLILGFIAFLSYVTDSSLGEEFYWVTFGLYNSVFAGIVCLYATTLNSPPILPFA